MTEPRETSPFEDAVAVIQKLDADFKTKPIFNFSATQRQDLLRQIPGGFLEAHADAFHTAIFIMMYDKNDWQRTAAFDEVLASPAMMQGRPQDCATVIRRAISFLPPAAREEKIDYILKGSFGQRLAAQSPDAYTDLVSSLSEDSPTLLEAREIGTYEIPVQKQMTGGGHFNVPAEHTLTAFFVKPSLGLPPLIQISSEGTTSTHPPSAEHLDGVPPHLAAHLADTFRRRAQAIQRTHPQAAAALTSAVQKLEPVGA